MCHKRKETGHFSLHTFASLRPLRFNLNYFNRRSERGSDAAVFGGLDVAFCGKRGILELGGRES